MFAGVFDFGRPTTLSAHVRGANLERILCPYRQPDATGVLENEHLLLVEAKLCRDAGELVWWERHQLPQRCAVSGRAIAWWGRLDNREELASQLGVSALSTTDEELVLAAFARWDTAAAERLTGDFAGVVVDVTSR